ncbi:hypothetical protein [Salinibacter ruber]|uniref:hypothetical protein n=1 Tax=Salinibacter ruber TaxID=146919 RepID=UPI0021677E8E|nr:hypothetical protein [Salinibacter ruber]MCS4034459.1 hypothetical protein [Salinibacter ruber]MCS4050705.1 hypothetical protein [Salinibacter ruber]
MLSFILVAATLGGLAYYFFGGEKTEEPKQTGPKGTANRNRTLDRQAPGETGRPEIHRPKVESAAAETLRRAEDRAEDLLRRGGEKKLAWESYFLAESIQEMFAHSEFFEGRRRFDSFRTALKAAEDARDKLIESRREEARQKEMASAEGPGHLRDMYVRNAVESTLVIAWCAGGLLGKSRRESAREAFCVSVSAEEVQDWSRFDQLLRKERERCMAGKHPEIRE